MPTERLHAPAPVRRLDAAGRGASPSPTGWSRPSPEGSCTTFRRSASVPGHHCSPGRGLRRHRLAGRPPRGTGRGSRPGDRLPTGRLQTASSTRRRGRCRRAWAASWPSWPSAFAAEPLTGRWLAEIQAERLPGTYPVALAVVLAALGASEEEAFAVHQYGVLMHGPRRGAPPDAGQTTSTPRAILFERRMRPSPSDYAERRRRDARRHGRLRPDGSTSWPPCHVSSHVRMFMS